MKVIFLDIDGVLNPFSHLSPEGNFSKIACKHLNALLEGCPEAKVVISSSWRHRGLDVVKDVLKRNGIDCDRVIGMTDETNHDDRGHHIERWLKDHSVEKFVILDDDSDMTDKEYTKLVKTNSWIGLTEKDVKLALDILK